ncbi:MAG: Flp family type IVb pilin [Thermodesulfobacteriota bacterium]
MEGLRKILKDETGASAVEYGLMVALIAAVIIGAVTAFGTGLRDLFNQLAGLFPVGGGSP